MKYDLKKQLRSFRYAWAGIRRCAGREQNLTFHLVAAVVVVVAGCVCGLSRWEWVAVVMAIAAVISAELMNSAVERLTDLVSPEYHPIAGAVKDIAAGAVLVTAIGAAVVGVIVFLI